MWRMRFQSIGASASDTSSPTARLSDCARLKMPATATNTPAATASPTTMMSLGEYL
ncbi:hypothetical protein D3C71_1830670 [compost metagenome]